MSTLKDKALSDLSQLMDSLDSKKQTLLSYWISDYAKFLTSEKTFDSKRLVRYKRGSVVQAHLGFRIGNEEGGLHYAVVVDTKNERSSGVVTVIPLTSIKPNTDLGNLHPSKLYLGNELYTLVHNKILKAQEEGEEIKQTLLQKIDEFRKSEFENDQEQSLHSETSRILVSGILREIDILEEKMKFLKKMNIRISKLKPGSIALVGQITTISKIRIYDPLYPNDTLTNIRLSDNTLDKIDIKVKELFTKNM